MVNLHKDRRSGLDRRVGPSSNSLARLDMERELREAIRHLQDRENEKDREISNLKTELEKVQQWQTENGPILQGARMIVNAGIVVKWVIAFVLGGLAVIGGVFGVMEGFRKWFVE